MFSFKNTFFTLLAVIIIFVACEPDPVELTDTTKPTFQIDAPSTNEQYLSDEPVPIKVELRDDNELASYKVLVRNLVTDELVFIVSETTEDDDVEIDDSFVVSVAEETDFQLEIEIEDAAGNETSESRVFQILPPSGGILALNMKLMYQDQPLVMFERYDYEGMKLFFTRFSTYLSNVILKNGGDETEVLEVDFLNLTDSHETVMDAENGFTYQIGGVPTGNYDGLQFSIGVNETLNAQVPADFPPSSPLSKSGEYWASWESFIFQKTEAKLDIDGDDEFETQVALHLGSDDAFRTKNLERNIVVQDNETTNITLTVDVYEMLIQNDDAYDLVANPQIHSLSQVNLIRQLADNLLVAIE